jgi:choline monooxygenase
MSASVKEIVESYRERPLAEASTPPSSWYNDPRICELEQCAVFQSSWQFVGRAEQLAGAGQFITADVAGEPIAVVCGSDHVTRGFFNVCRHHAAAVLAQPCGKIDYLRCPYHGWTYDLEGRLVLTPEFTGAAEFDRAANGLNRIDVQGWQSWIFAKLVNRGLPLGRFLGRALLDQFEKLALNRFHWFERRTYSVACNWKVFIDNYLDGGYHVPHIHAGLNSVLDYTHYVVETGDRYCLQSSPLSTGQAEPDVAAARSGERAYYYWIYPNFMINIYGRAMDTNWVLPRGVDRTDVVFDFYFTDVSPQANEANLASIAVSEQIQAEDVAICESVQRGLRSRAYTAGRLAVRREAGEHLFHRLLHADLSAAVSA